jgi:hypothetical protein
MDPTCGVLSPLAEQAQPGQKNLGLVTAWSPYVLVCAKV